MKIVLPVHHFPPKFSAGAELYTFRLARWLQQQGHVVHVVTVDSIKQGSYEKLGVEDDNYQGVPVSRLSFNVYAAPLDSHFKKVWEFNNPLLGAWFKDFYARYKPDLAHFQAGYLIGAAPLFAAQEANVPVILTLHDYWFLCQRITLLKGNDTLCDQEPNSPTGCTWCQALRGQTARRAERYLGKSVGKVLAYSTRHLRREVAMFTERHHVLPKALQVPRLVIAPSKFLASKYADLVPANRLLVSGYGLDLSRFQSVAASWHDSTNPFRIGFIGQIAPHKGVHLIIQAFRALQANGRQLELHIYGDPKLFEVYAQQCKDLAAGDDRIHFHGRFENARVVEVLRSFDVSVVPSTWYENAPLAILESRAAGVPVITSRLGGMAELVQHELDGLHFTPEDAADLARQFQRILDEPELLPRLKAGTAQRVPRSIEDEMAQLMGLYESLTNAGSRVI
jgi:glycosyltransferase involved in cell wall biosynthesis